MKYEKLIELVSKNDVLQNAIKTILKTDRDEILNLAHPDWQQRLFENNLYQKYKDSQIPFLTPKFFQYIKIQRVQNPDDIFKILVVGLFSINKTDKYNTVFIQCNQCPPLDEIGKVFMADENCQLSPCCKFYVDSCGYVSCRYCPKEVINHNIPPHSIHPWWCVIKTKVFNGDSVKSVFRHTIERDFQKSMFVGILTLKIGSRQFFGDAFNKMKLVGNVENMILFKEQSLDPVCDMSESIFSDERFLTHTNEIDVQRVNHSNKSDGEKTENINFIPNAASSSFATASQNETETVVDCVPSSYLKNLDNDDDNGQDFKIEHDKEFKL